MAWLVKNSPAAWETWVQSLGWEDPLEKGTALNFPGSSKSKTSAYNAGDPGSIPGWGRSPGEGNGNPLQHSCLENPMGGGAWQATVRGVAESVTTEHFTFTHSSILAWRTPWTV